MTNINDFLLPNGVVNWKAFHEAQVEEGKLCYKCRSSIFFTVKKRSSIMLLL